MRYIGRETNLAVGQPSLSMNIHDKCMKNKTINRGRVATEVKHQCKNKEKNQKLICSVLYRFAQRILVASFKRISQ